MRVLRTLGIAGALGALSLTSLPAGPAAGSTVTFGAPVMVSANDEQAAAEPSIRAARDGTLYIAAPTGLGGARVEEKGTGGDLIWRSTDGGRTWEYLGNYDPAAGGGDADIAPDRRGTLWASGLSLANTTVGISTDKGDNFVINPVGSLDTVVDRQWIETYRAEPFAFLTTGRIADRTIILSRIERTPAGIPVVSETIDVSAEDPYQWPGEIAVDEVRGLVYVGYNTIGDSEDEDKIVVSRTNLELGDLETNVAATSNGDTFDSFVAIDVDLAGNLYAVWTERRPEGAEGKLGRTVTVLAVSKDRGQTWTRPRVINDRARTTTFPWIVAGARGRVAVAYYGVRQLGASPEHVVYPDRPLPRWKVYVSYSLNAHERNATFTEVRAHPGFIHEGNVCTSGTGCAAGTRDLLDFFQIDLDPCGRAVITYTDNSNDEVTEDGQRTVNNPEYVGFVKQDGGPRFYADPLNPKIC